MSDADPHAAVRESAAAVGRRLGHRTPDLAIILGSGLGNLIRSLRNAVEIGFADIPGFPSTGVIGHAGLVVSGDLEGRSVIALAGRLHLYEGHSPELAALPVRMLHELGARTLLVSNAAGGIRRTLRTGDLMLIEDHINLMWRNPLMGAVREKETRFPDMSAPYDAGLLGALRQAALEEGIPVVTGVYAGLIGPSYETPAEVRMLERLGADAVGMSTVPEVIVARALGMRVAGISCIANMAAGLSHAPVDHADVLRATAAVSGRFEALTRRFVAGLGAQAK